MSVQSDKQITVAIAAAIECLRRFAASHLSRLVVDELLQAQGFCATCRTDDSRARVANALEGAWIYIAAREQASPLRDLVLAELAKAKAAV